MLDYEIIFLNSLKHFTHTEFTALKLVFLVIYILVVEGLETQKFGFFFSENPLLWMKILIFCVLLWEDQQRVPELESKSHSQICTETVDNMKVKKKEK